MAGPAAPFGHYGLAGPPSGAEVDGSAAVVAVEAEAKALLDRIVADSAGGGHPNVGDLHALARLFEREDERYLALVGDDPSTNARGAYAVGRLIGLVHDTPAAEALITGTLVALDGRAPVATRAAALRLAGAYLGTLQYDLPLYESRTVTRLQLTALGEEVDGNPSVPGDSSSLDRRRCVTYATAVLAAALQHEDVAATAVQGPLVGRLMRTLRSHAAVAAAAHAAGDAPPASPEPAGGVTLSADVADGPHLESRAARAVCRALACAAEFAEALAPAHAEGALPATLTLLGAWSTQPRCAADALRLACALLAHRRFAVAFVDGGGIARLLALPSCPLTAGGVALALHLLGATAAAWEKACALPAVEVSSLADATVALIATGHGPARKAAAALLSTALSYRAFLDAFSAVGGPRRLCATLAALLSPPSGATPLVDKQVGALALVALRQYMRCGALHLLAGLRARLAATMTPSGGVGPPLPRRLPGYKALDASPGAWHAALSALEHAPRLWGAWVARTAAGRWAPHAAVVTAGGPSLLLRAVEAAAPGGARGLSDWAGRALETLHAIALVPSGADAILATPGGAGLLLSAAAGVGVVTDDAGWAFAALGTLGACVGPPPRCPLPSAAIAAAKSATTHAAVSVVGGDDGQGTVGGVPAVVSSHPPMTPAPMPRPLESHAAPPPTIGATPVAASTPAIVAPTPGGTTVGAPAHVVAAAACYARCRSRVRTAGGIRVLLSVLDTARGVLPLAGAMAAPSGPQLQGAACRALLGLATDVAQRQLLVAMGAAGRLSDVLLAAGAAAAVRPPPPPGVGDEDAPTPLAPDGPTPPAAWEGAVADDLRHDASALMALTAPGGHPPQQHRNHHHHQAVMAPPPSTAAGATPLEALQRGAVAASTRVTYARAELLSLIAEHLTASGLPRAAAALVAEAGLAVNTTQHKQHGHSHNHHHVNHNPAAKDDGDEGGVTGVGHKRTAAAAALSPPPPARRPPHTAAASPPSTRTLVYPMAANGAPASGVHAAVMSPPPPPPSVGSLLAALPRVAQPQWGGRTPATITRRPLAIGRALTAATPGDPPVPPPTVAPLPDTGHVGPFTAGAEGAVASRLDAIVTTYLRQQHAACARPVAALPPFSLLRPHACPQPRVSRSSRRNIATRLAGREVVAPPAGGPGPGERERRFVHTRHRPWRVLREEAGDGVPLTACAFVCGPPVGPSVRLAMGNASGRLSIWDVGERREVASAGDHTAAITLLSPSPSPSTSMLLSCSPREVKLWDVGGGGGMGPSLADGSTYTWDGWRQARWAPSGDRLVALSTRAGALPLTLRVFDATTGAAMASLGEADAAGPGADGAAWGTSASRFGYGACFSPDGSSVLWGGVLWDTRCARPYHRFDLLTELGGGCFHPRGYEVIINSEVWDVRTRCLTASVPALDGTTLAFALGGDVAYARPRLRPDDPLGSYRRRRHPLRFAFRAVDAAAGWATMCDVDAGRAVLSLAVGDDSAHVAVALHEGHDDADACVRVYEVGRQRPPEGDSDAEGDDGDDDDDDEEDEEDESDLDSELNAFLGGGGGDSDSDSAGEGDGAGGGAAALGLGAEGILQALLGAGGGEGSGSGSSESDGDGESSGESEDDEDDDDDDEDDDDEDEVEDGNDVEEGEGDFEMAFAEGSESEDEESH